MAERQKLEKLIKYKKRGRMGNGKFVLEEGDEIENG